MQTNQKLNETGMYNYNAIVSKFKIFLNDHF